MTNLEKITRLRECAIEIEKIRMQYIIDKMMANISYNSECLGIEISRQISEKVLDPYSDTPAVEVNLSSTEIINRLSSLAEEMGASSIQECNYIIDSIDKTELYYISLNDGDSEYLVHESELEAALEKRGIKQTTKHIVGANLAYKFTTDLRKHTLSKKPETEDK